MRQKPRMISLRLQKWNHLFRLQKTEWKIPKMWVFQLTLNLNKTFKKLKTKKKWRHLLLGKMKASVTNGRYLLQINGEKTGKDSYSIFIFAFHWFQANSCRLLIHFIDFHRLQSMWILTQQPSCQCKCWFAWNNRTITQRNWSATTRVRKL